MDNEIGTAIKRIVYKKIVPGDLRKFTATSNDRQTGGGARDLRFSPANEFFPVFEKMFTAFDTTGVLRGYFYWDDHSPTEVFIHPPTNSRPNETRIGKIHECFPARYIPDDARDCILLIVQDGDSKVRPYFTSEHSLEHDGWHPLVKENILSGLRARRNAKTTAMGYVDFEIGGSYTNGQ